MSTAPGDTLYTFRSHAKVVFQRGVDNDTHMKAYRDGAEVIPTSATYRLYAPDGTNLNTGVNTPIAVIGAATLTIDALDLPDTLTKGPGYQEVWGLLIGGELHTVRRQAVVGLFKLFPPIAELDLVGEYPDLVTSLGTGGSTALQGFLDGAWHEAMRYLERHGSWPDIVADSNDLFDWIRHMTLKRAFGSMLMRQPSQRWQSLFDEHRDEAKLAKSGLRITVDRDRDGKADNLKKEPMTRSFHVNIPPRRVPRNNGKW